MWRFTKLTYAFNKKADNIKAAVVLNFAHYSSDRIH